MSRFYSIPVSSRLAIRPLLACGSNALGCGVITKAGSVSSACGMGWDGRPSSSNVWLLTRPDCQTRAPVKGRRPHRPAGSPGRVRRRKTYTWSSVLSSGHTALRRKDRPSYNNGSRCTCARRSKRSHPPAWISPPPGKLPHRWVSCNDYTTVTGCRQRRLSSTPGPCVANRRR